MPSLSAVVVTYDSAAVLPACLDALSGEGVRALVVDNASGDATAEVAKAHGAELLPNTRNEGYGRANNRGVRAVETDLVLIVNPDIELQVGAAAALLAAADAYPDAALLAPRIVEPSGRLFFQPWSLLAPYLRNERGLPVAPEGDCCAPFLSGACLLVRREAFLRVGGFDEDIFLFYEDDDLCRRVADAGLALVHVHDAVARHGRGRSSAPKPGRVFRSRWHQAWSRAYVARKYGLPNPAYGTLAANAPKWAAATLVRRHDLSERYGGSAAGALAALRGVPALEYEGLRPAGEGRG